MALHWDVSKVKDVDKLHATVKDAEGNPLYKEGDPEYKAGEAEWAITNCLIWLTIGLDMGDITEANWMEFYQRVALLQKLDGAFLHDWKDGVRSPFWITPGMVRRRIGLSTNVSKVAFTTWRNRTIKRWMESEERKLKSRLKDAPSELRALQNGDDWTERHDKLADILMLDPDNFRARPDSDNWPEEMRGKVTEADILHRQVSEAVGDNVPA